MAQENGDAEAQHALVIKRDELKELMKPETRRILIE